MKPTCPLNEIDSRHGSLDAAPRRARQPRIDFNFRPNSLRDFGGRGGRKRFPSIRDVSEEYFNSEARQHFASEAAFFVLIVATVAVPLFEVVRGLFDWVL